MEPVFQADPTRLMIASIVGIALLLFLIIKFLRLSLVLAQGCLYS